MFWNKPVIKIFYLYECQRCKIKFTGHREPFHGNYKYPCCPACLYEFHVRELPYGS